MTVGARAGSRRIALLIGLAIIFTLIPSKAVRAEIERFALIIGNNVGDRDETELRYAEDDASKVYDVLRNLGGFRPENMVLLRGDSAEGARQALIGLNRRVRRETAFDRPATMLFVYYSGHADADTLHMGDSGFSLRQLKELVEGSAAAFRILVLDGCRSGALTRLKGGQVAPPVSIVLRDRLAGEGTVFLTATSANEDAQESDEIKGSFFTHYLVSGLLGAADASGDGQVVLEEAYRYAYDHTLRASSRTLAGTQHPTYRYDLRGQGLLVLSRLVSQRRAIVGFPAGRSYLLFQGGPDGPVVAEVGSQDAVRRLSVEAGHYFVRARATRYLLEGTVELERDTERAIGDSARASLFESGPCMGPYAGYALEMRALTIVPRIGLCSATALRASPGGREFTAEVRLMREWDTRWITAGLGVVPGLALLADSSVVDGALVSRYRAVAMLGTAISATVELAGSSYASLEVGAQTYIQRKRTLIFSAAATSRDPPRGTDNELDAAMVLRAGLGVGVRW